MNYKTLLLRARGLVLDNEDYISKTLLAKLCKMSSSQNISGEFIKGFANCIGEVMKIPELAENEVKKD